MTIRHLATLALMCASIGTAAAQQADAMAGMTPEQLAQMAPLPTVIPAPDDRNAIPLYGAKTPGTAKSENWSDQGGNVIVRNVTRPTITPVLPDPAKATGAAVIIAPGGGFVALSTETEGFQQARFLAARGVAAFVLKYRLVASPADEAKARLFSIKRLIAGLQDVRDGGTAIQNPESTADALAALALVRGRAAEWKIDPKRVGMIGYSAGAMTSLRAALAPDVAARPSFIGFVYGPQAMTTVPTGVPPMFDAIAFDDQIFPTMGFAIAEAWRKAGSAVEVHGYERGGHGFGMGMAGTTTTLLMEEFVAWMSMHGYMKSTP